MSEESSTEKLVARRAKAKTQPPVDNRSRAEKEIDDAYARSKIKQDHDRKRKKLFKGGIIALVILLLGYGAYYLFKPFKGTMAFGICKTYLEMNVRYPQTLYVSTIESFQASVRLWFVQVDSFGEYRLEPIQCYFKPDPNGAVPFLLEKIVISRRTVDQQKVEEFNRILPVIFANPPDLTIPYALPDSLQDLKIDTDSMRKPIL